MVNLPPGFISHEAGECPVPPDSKPGVMFGNGRIYPLGLYPAWYWTRTHDDDCDLWQHEGCRPSEGIIAYLPQDAG